MGKITAQAAVTCHHSETKGHVGDCSKVERICPPQRRHPPLSSKNSWHMGRGTKIYRFFQLQNVGSNTTQAKQNMPVDHQFATSSVCVFLPLSSTPSYQGIL